MTSLRLAASAALLAALAAAASGASAEPGVFAFGDSALEQGNLYRLPGIPRPATPPYFDEGGFVRDSNGPVWIEQAYRGMRPLLAGEPYGRRINFAFSGATTGTGNSVDGAEGTGLASQVERFEALVAAGAIAPRKGDLFFIDAGPNDIFRAMLQGAPPEAVVAAGAQGGRRLAEAAFRLADAGARLVFVNDFVDAGLAPGFLDAPPVLPALATEAADAGAAALREALRAGAAAHPGATVALIQSRPLVRAILANPARYGFDEARRACFDEASGALCAPDRHGQNRYLFLDQAGHPTEAGQTLLARHYSATVASLDGGRQRELAGVAEAAASPFAAFGRQLSARAVPPAEGWTGFVLGGADLARADGDGDAGLVGLGVEGRAGALALRGAVAAASAEVSSGALDGDSGSLMAGLHAGWSRGPWFFGAALVAGRAELDDLSRDIGLPGFTATGSTDAGYLGAALEAGRSGALGAWTWGVSATLEAERFEADPYRERGAEGLELEVEELETRRVGAGLRLRLARPVSLADRPATIGLVADLAYPLLDETETRTVLPGSETGATTFSDDDRAPVFSLAPELSVDLGGGLVSTLRYESRIEDGDLGQTAMVTLGLRF